MGRNVWRSDRLGARSWTGWKPVARNLGDRLWVAPSCSLLHVPVNLEGEEKMDRGNSELAGFCGPRSLMSCM